MKAFTAGILITLVTCVLSSSIAAGTETRPKVGRSAFPTNPWGISDFGVGFVLGSFGPIAELSRGGDCYSGMYDWGKEAISFSRYFDRSFPADAEEYSILIIKSLYYAYLTYNWIAVCVAEHAQNKREPWHHNYGYLSRDVRV